MEPSPLRVGSLAPAVEEALGPSIRRPQGVCVRGGELGPDVKAHLGVLHTALDIDVNFVLDTIGRRETWDAARVPRVSFSRVRR